MNRIFTLLVATITAVGTSKAQSDIEVYLDGSGPNLASSTLTVNLDNTSPELVGSVYQAHLKVVNVGTSDHQIQIVRKRISSPASWTDELCWGVGCYPPNASNPWSTPNTSGNPAPMMGSTDTLELKPKITLTTSSSDNALYRYYFKDVTSQLYLDSVDMEISYTAVASVPVVKQLPSFSISPNPADHHITIATTGMEACTIRIVDVLGNEVYNEYITSANKLVNVAEFKTGVYFVLIEPSGSKVINRKLIVKH